MILLVAEMQELKANPNRQARGTIIEARLDKGRGPVATLLVQNGTHACGRYHRRRYGLRPRACDGQRQGTSASPMQVPSTPVEIIGFNDVPAAGDILYAVERRQALPPGGRGAPARRCKAAQIKAMQKTTLDDLFSQMQEGEMKDLNLIVKADVQGSVEAVRSSLEKLSNDEVRVRCIHGGAGAINETRRHRWRQLRTPSSSASTCARMRRRARLAEREERGRSSLPRHLRCDRGNRRRP